LFLVAKISALISIDRPNHYGSIVNQTRDSGSDHKFIKDHVYIYIVTENTHKSYGFANN